MNFIRPVFLICALTLFITPLLAQSQFGWVMPLDSPAATVAQTIGVTDITVKYHRPLAKGRKVFGGLEPYGKVWRAGANHATTIAFSTDVKIEGQPLAAGQASPPATIHDMAWFAGRWTGDGLGGQNEETWGPPEHGRMIGTFKHSQNGKPVFYEFMTFFEHEGSLVLRLKHFNPDLTGWEEKDKFGEFKFVAKKDGAMYFNGLTFMPDGPNGSKDAAKIYLALRNKDGAVNEVARDGDEHDV
jgi:hypothetical protein